MIELINRGRAEIIEFDDNEILIRDMSTGIHFHTWLKAWAGAREEYEGILTEDRLKRFGVNCLVAHQEQIAKLVEAMPGFELQIGCRNVVYTQKERLSVTNLYRPDGKPTKAGVTIRALEPEMAKEVYEIYSREGEEYISDRIKTGNIFGAFIEESGKENLAGIVGFHGEGSIGILHVKNEYRGRKLGKALETYACNEALSRGWIPYGQVEDSNEVSLRLQESLGLYSSKEKVFWLEG
ncbi:MAG: GNAT family N-acetyltransferase [Agathobacter sp.]|nr:GNAT family N-acetyltransferase [Agathobacter sp.]